MAMLLPVVGWGLVGLVVGVGVVDLVVGCGGCNVSQALGGWLSFGLRVLGCRVWCCLALCFGVWWCWVWLGSWVPGAGLLLGSGSGKVGRVPRWGITGWLGCLVVCVGSLRTQQRA